jgi:hypothetical protein
MPDKESFTNSFEQMRASAREIAAPLGLTKDELIKVVDVLEMLYDKNNPFMLSLSAKVGKHQLTMSSDEMTKLIPVVENMLSAFMSLCQSYPRQDEIAKVMKEHPIIALIFMAYAETYSDNFSEYRKRKENHKRYLN